MRRFSWLDQAGILAKVGAITGYYGSGAKTGEEEYLIYDSVTDTVYTTQRHIEKSPLDVVEETVLEQEEV